MTLTIDSPCVLRSRPASGDRAASFTLDIIGGSLWFPADSVPQGIADGAYSKAVLEVSPRSTGGQVARTVFAPNRIISLK